MLKTVMQLTVQAQISWLHAAAWPAGLSLLQAWIASHPAPIHSSSSQSLSSVANSRHCHAGCSYMPSSHLFNVDKQCLLQIQQQQQMTAPSSLPQTAGHPQQQIHLRLQQPSHTSALLITTSLPCNRSQQRIQQSHALLQFHQVRCYHPSQHRARALTVKLQQKRQWQDLQLLFDSNGAGKSLNAIHLTTMLLQLSRIAPQTELLPADERQRLKQFIAELVSATHLRLHRLDHRGLASFTHSLVALGYDPIRTTTTSATAATVTVTAPTATAASTATGVQQSRRGGRGVNDLFGDIVQAVVHQLPYANSQSCSVICTSLAALLRQQQQQQQGLDSHQQQQFSAFVAALTQRLQSMTAGGAITAVEACRVCCAASKLIAAVRATASSSSCVESELPTNPASAERADAMHAKAPSAAAVRGAAGAAASISGLSTTPRDLARQLRDLVLLAAQQTAAAVADSSNSSSSSGIQAGEAQIAPGDASMLLYSLAKSRVAPGWQTLLLLLQQYKSGVRTLILAGDAQNTKIFQSHSSSRQHQQQEIVEDKGAGAGSATAVLVQSLPSAIWATGRLLELELQSWLRRARGNRLQHRDSKLQQQELQWLLQQSCSVLSVMDECVSVGGMVMSAFSPVQLVQLAAGLAKAVGAAADLLDTAKTQINATSLQAGQQVKATDSGYDSQQPWMDSTVPDASQSSQEADELGEREHHADLQLALQRLTTQLQSPSLQQFLRLHVARVQGLLPLLPVDLRLQLADCYRQLVVELPRNIAVVFQRDALAAASAS